MSENEENNNTNENSNNEEIQKFKDLISEAKLANSLLALNEQAALMSIKQEWKHQHAGEEEPSAMPSDDDFLLKIVERDAMQYSNTQAKTQLEKLAKDAGMTTKQYLLMTTPVYAIEKELQKGSKKSKSKIKSRGREPYPWEILLKKQSKD